MGFNLYFAGADPKADDLLKSLDCKRLFSQLNERSRIGQWQSDGYGKNLFVDSGAFTEAHTGKKVNIDEYINFINSNKDIKIFAELDKIPYPNLTCETAKESARISWDNYVYMKDKIRKDCYLLPLYHFGEPKEALINILNTEIDGKRAEYIGIGGRHGVSNDIQEKYFHEIFSIIQKSKNPNVKVHVFGMTVLNILEKYPFYSADSTTWLQLAIHASIFTKTAGIILVGSKKSHVKENFFNLHSDAKEKILNEVNQLGFDIDELSVDLAARMKFNVYNFKDWADNYKYKGPKSFISHTLF